jgi:pimeloyl-ACP methyl ester carboxylesterase
MKVYFISGIAADCRLFKNIFLPEGFERIFLEWIVPLRNETIAEYAYRLAEKINPNEPFLLIGTSLGGIIASEISLRYNPLATIIIASVPVISQLPGYYRLVNSMNMQKLVPGSLYKFSAVIKHYFSREKAEDKKIIIRMIKETDPDFIRWGINAILKWSNRQIPKNLYHIHGTRDEIFPYGFTSPTHTIPKGDHVIVITRSKEINSILAGILASVTFQ